MSTIKKQGMSNDLADSQDDFSVDPSFQIKGSEKGSVTSAWIGVALFAFACWWFMGWAHMPIFLPHQKYPNPIACILGIIGLLVVGKAVYETIRLKRFGDPILELSEGKGVTGGILAGRINLGPWMTRAPEFVLTLSCLHYVKQLGDKNGRTLKLWSGQQKATLMPGGVLPISISIPGDQPPTSNGDPFDRIYWTLSVTAPFRPVGFSEKYEIPVFAGSGNSMAETGSEMAPAYPSTQASKGFILLFLIPCLIGGAILLYHGLNDIRQGIAAQNWPVATGTIVTSQIHRTGKNDSNYEPTIHYVYDVNGRIFSGTEIYPHWFWSHRTTQSAIDAFPVAQHVSIYYEADHPEHAMLQPGWRAEISQGLICAGLLLSFGGILAVAFFAPAKDVNQGRGSVSYKPGTWESKASGMCFVGLIVLGLLLWYVT